MSVVLGDASVPESGPVIGSTSVCSAPVGYRFPREVIAVPVRWFLRYGLSYRNVEELLRERRSEVDLVSVDRWVQTIIGSRCSAVGPVRADRPPTFTHMPVRALLPISVRTPLVALVVADSHR